MPLLDVSDVLDDPDFNESFTIFRATSVVDKTGLNVVTPAGPAIVIGVIQPAGAKDLDRLPDQSRQGGSIQIWTRFPIALDALPVFAADGVTVITPGTEADQIVWNGSTYTVMTCDPWLYGSGYWRSLASLASLR